MRAKNVVWDKKDCRKHLFYFFWGIFTLKRFDETLLWRMEIRKCRKKIIERIFYISTFLIYTSFSFIQTNSFLTLEDYLINSMSNIHTQCHFSKHHLYNILDNNWWLFMINNMKSIYWYIAGDDGYDDQYVII